MISFGKGHRRSSFLRATEYLGSSSTGDASDLPSTSASGETESSSMVKTPAMEVDEEHETDSGETGIRRLKLMVIQKRYPS